MHKLNYGMSQLLNKLQTYKSICGTTKGGGEENVAGGKAQKSKQDLKEKKPNTKKNGAKQPKGKYFHCDVQGHSKRNCPKYLAKLAEKKHQNGKSDLHVLEAKLVEVNTSSWIIDSGATNYVCSSLQLLRSFRELAEGEMIMHVGNGATVSAKAIGEACLQFGVRYLDL